VFCGLENQACKIRATAHSCWVLCWLGGPGLGHMVWGLVGSARAGALIPDICTVLEQGMLSKWNTDW